MTRNYKRTSNKSSYTKEKLLDAVRAVRNGELSGYKAARIYNIPRMTIMDHLNNKRWKSTTLGRPPAISVETENKLASHLHTMERYGFGLSRDEVLELVGHYVNLNKIKTPFKNGKPGKDWFAAFKDRNNLSVKKPQAVEYARKKAVDPYIIYPYFDLLEKTINQLGLTNNPRAVWNLDETSFSKDPSKTKIVGRKGHAATRMIASPGKDNTTVLLAANAAGEKIPPLIIFKGKNVWDQWTSPNAYPQTTYAATTNGWMETEVFENYFKKSFLPALGNERPILLLYDGHSTHVGLNIMEEALKQNVTIIKLPPHTSHLLQPLDVAVMKSFKDRWDPLLVKWQRLNIGVPLPKSEFSRLIGTVWAQIDPDVIRNGFRKSGIHPLNRGAINENKFDTLKLKKWKRFINTPALPNGQQNSTFPILVDQPDIPPVNSNISQKGPKTLLSIVLEFIKKNTNLIDEPSQNLNNDTSEANLVSFEEFLIDEPGPNLNNDTSEANLVSFEEFLIDEPGQNQTNNYNISEQNSHSFEELLLSKIQRGDNKKTTRRKVAPGAEVITHIDVIERKRLEHTKSSKKQKPRPSTSSTVTYLGQISRNDDQMQSFAVDNPCDLPHCIQNKIPDARKIKVLSNIVIKPAISHTYNKISTNTKGKGKGINKKSSGKENVLSRNKHKSKRNLSSHSSTTTSASGDMSSHSDSDLLDLASDDEGYKDSEEFVLERAGRKQKASYLTTRTSNFQKRNEKSDSPSSEIDDQSDLQLPVNIIQYYAEDCVLVRYYTKNKWTYYVGIIENIATKNEKSYYCIRFYKTIKKPSLIFKMPKKADRDEVPEILIIKPIKLVHAPSKSNEFVLADEGDAIYF